MKNIKQLINNKKGAMGLSPFSKTIILTVVIALFIMMFVIQFLGTTNPNSPVLTDYGLQNSSTMMNNSLNSFTSAATDIKTQLSNSKPSPVQFIFLIFEAAFYIPIKFVSFLYIGVTSLTDVLFPGLGGNWSLILTIAMSVIGTIMIIELVLLVIKAVRTGESER